jgi:hypothetical protein
MSTSPISFRRRARRGALALIVSAFLVPASSALAQGDSPSDYPGMPGNPQTQPPFVSTGSGDTPADYPGMPGNPQTAARVASTVSGDNPADFPGMPGSPQIATPVASQAPEASGFDWISAVIGAGAAGLLIVVALGGAAAVSRLRFRTTVRS